MKKGTYKKIVLSLLGIFLVFGSLIAPLTNKDVAHAQSNQCKYVSSKFDPSGDNLTDYTESDTYPISVLVDVENCKGKEVAVSIISDTPFFYTDTEVIEVKKLIQNEKGSRISFKFKRANDKCNGTLGLGVDCKYHYKVSLDGSSVYNSENKNAVHGVISYNDKVGGVFGKYYAWELTSSSEDFVNLRSGEVIDFWYFKLKDGKYIPASAERITEDECKKLIDGKDGYVGCAKAGTFDESLIVEGSQSGNPNLQGDCGVTSIDGFAWCFVGLAKILVDFVLGGLVAIAGKFFDLVFSISIDSRAYGGGGNTIQFLKDAWTLLRDFVNLGLILTLLFISIQQIISTSSDIIKKSLPKVILVGFLVNFSFFFGTVIVDSTNVLARLFYTNDAICVTQDGAPIDPATGKPECKGTISEALASKLQPQAIIAQSSNALLEMGQSQVSPGLYFLIIAISGFCLWKIFKVFFKVGMLFLGRIVQIWIHLIISPLAFLNEALPKGWQIKGAGDGMWGWAKKLFENAFIAPMFMFFLYLIFIALSGLELAFDFQKTDGTFASLIGLILPVIALTMILDASVDYTKEHAGKIANQLADMATKAIGAIAGTGLALGGLATGGLIVKQGGKLLSGAGRRLVAQEGKGNNALSRWGNSKLAGIGGRLNDYSKKLPDKKFDPRGSKWGKAVAGATGFDMSSYKDESNKALGYLGLKPSTSFKERQEKKLDDKEADIKRRQINEKTNKMDSELASESEKRKTALEKELLTEFGKQQGNTPEFLQYQQAMKRAGKSENEILEGWKNAPQNKEAFDKFKGDFEKIYKERISGSVDLFDASNRDAYEKAAKAYNKEVEQKFVEIEFLRRRENKKNKKVAEQVEKEEMSQERQKSKLVDIEESLKDLTDAIKNNTKTTKDASDNTTNSFQKFYDDHFKKQNDENAVRSKDEKWSDKKVENKAFNDAYSEFVKNISEVIRGLTSSIETASGTMKADLEERKVQAEQIKEEISKAKTSYDKKEDDRGKAEEALRKSKERLDKIREGSSDKKPDKKDDKGDDKK